MKLDDMLELIFKYRFGYLFRVDDYLLAAVYHPKLKFSLLKTNTGKKFARDRLNARIVNVVMVSSRTCKGSEDNPLNFDNDFSPTKDEVDSYVSDKDKSLSMLDRHPAMKKVSLSDDTALPSSEPFERLFSIAPLVFFKDLLLETFIT